jgi:hypothetical protein
VVHRSDLVRHVYEPGGAGVAPHQDVGHDAGEHEPGQHHPVEEEPGGEHPGVVPLAAVEPEGDAAVRGVLGTCPGHGGLA